MTSIIGGTACSMNSSGVMTNPKRIKAEALNKDR
jgi:hypothetical protein